jgi:hypothetical protein
VKNELAVNREYARHKENVSEFNLKDKNAREYA